MADAVALTARVGVSAAVMGSVTLLVAARAAVALSAAVSTTCSVTLAGLTIAVSRPGTNGIRTGTASLPITY